MLPQGLAATLLWIKLCGIGFSRIANSPVSFGPASNDGYEGGVEPALSNSSGCAVLRASGVTEKSVRERCLCADQVEGLPTLSRIEHPISNLLRLAHRER
jgi:hypothetical protein